MRRQRRGTKLLAGFFSLALLAAACGDDGESATPGTEGPDETSAPATDEVVPDGGTLVIGAEQEGECMDWMHSCGGSSWASWTVNFQTMPRAFDAVQEGDAYEYVPNILLKGEPELVSDPKQVVTYEIADEAVWDDGSPITSADFKYTWEQVAFGDAIYDRTGYDKVESVDATDPKVVVVTFKEPYADWKALFGGNFGVYPAKLGDGRNAAMKDGYTFSGGPWKLEKWEKGAEVVLVPNPNFWGDKPHLDKVIFKLQSDTSAEFQSFKTGQVSAIYPQPQLDTIDAINAGLTDAQASYTPNTGNFEALWINESVEPFTSKAVRQALAYSLDRDAIVKRLFGGIDINEALNVVNAPIVSEYSDTEAFAKYTKDLDKVADLLEGDGWTKGSDGIYAKAGKKLSFTARTTAGNKRRELTEQVLQQQFKEAGIEMTIDNQQASDLFGQSLPNGDFQAAIYAQVLTGLTPGLCNLFCSKNIPTAENGYSGQNWTRTNVPELDPFLLEVEGNLDEEARQEAGKKADQLLAEEIAAIPLDPLPNILLWNSSIVGPVSNNAILGPFWNLAEWGVKQ